MWEHAEEGGMTSERAYSTLVVPAEINDEMQITTFSMQVSTSFISDARKSVR
jgi:hypothetical protein